MPSHAHTRPTTDRVRESAFNLIADWAGTAGESAESMLDRFSFLDLYAGSGAVALEAASRGAAPVTAVEKDSGTAAVASGNAARLKLPVRVVTASVDAFLETAPSVFDIVWLDPPYRVDTDALNRQIATIWERGWIAPDGLVICERASRDEPITWPENVTHTWSRRYGETTLLLGTKEDG